MQALLVYTCDSLQLLSQDKSFLMLHKQTSYPAIISETLFNIVKAKTEANKYVEQELGIDEYSCVKDGGEFPVYDCPECGHDQLVYDAEANKFHCFHCFKDFDGEDLNFLYR